MRMKLLGVVAAILLGAGLLLVRQPSIDAKLAAIEPQLDARLKAREIQIDPAEVLDMIYNFNTPMRIIDLRDEADFNLFHIIDSQHASLDQVREPEWVKRLPQQTVIVLVSNDEKRATQAWKVLSAQGVGNLYILKGGINFWLDVYDQESLGRSDARQPTPNPGGDDILRHRFVFALGANHPAADPDPKHVARRDYVKKVKPIGRAPKKTGGCG